MKPLPPPRSLGDPDLLLRIEVERPLENGGRLRVVSSIPQKTLLWVVALTVGSLAGWPLLASGLRLISVFGRWTR